MKVLSALATLAFAVPAVAGAQMNSAATATASTAAIDTEVWSVISATVVNADIKGMAATYHPDAVVVTPGNTLPIGEMLPQWGKSMEQMAAGGASATVEFRFSSRMDNAKTAFEVGIFKYTVTDNAGKSTSYIIPMEALLIRTDAGWRILMERQLAPVGAEEWNKLAP